MTDQYLTGSDARSNMNSRATPVDGRESRGISRLKTLIPSSIVARTSPKQTRHPAARPAKAARSEEHTSELQSRGHLVCRLLLEKKKERHKDRARYAQEHN